VAQARAAVDAINRSWAGELKAARAGEVDDRMSKARDAVRLARSQIIPPHHIILSHHLVSFHLTSSHHLITLSHIISSRHHPIISSPALNCLIVSAFQPVRAPRSMGHAARLTAAASRRARGRSSGPGAAAAPAAPRAAFPEAM
jgi:hypothetical protein